MFVLVVIGVLWLAWKEIQLHQQMKSAWILLDLHNQALEGLTKLIEARR